jgi:hypothetical protein
MERQHLSCEDFARIGAWDTRRCCQSCHRDIARGIEGIQTTAVANVHGKEPHVVIELCCNFVLMPSEGLDHLFSRDLFAALLRARRRERRQGIAVSARRPPLGDYPPPSRFSEPEARPD